MKARRFARGALALALVVILSGCSSFTVSDPSGVVVRAKLPAWPWQDSSRVIERLTISRRGTNFNLSLHGLTDAENTSTNLADAFRAGADLLKAAR